MSTPIIYCPNCGNCGYAGKEIEGMLSSFLEPFTKQHLKCKSCGSKGNIEVIEDKSGCIIITEETDPNCLGKWSDVYYKDCDEKCPNRELCVDMEMGKTDGAIAILEEYD